jgi:hypothetical protein
MSDLEKDVEEFFEGEDDVESCSSSREEEMMMEEEEPEMLEDVPRHHKHSKGPIAKVSAKQSFLEYVSVQNLNSSTLGQPKKVGSAINNPSWTDQGLYVKLPALSQTPSKKIGAQVSEEPHKVPGKVILTAHNPGQLPLKISFNANRFEHTVYDRDGNPGLTIGPGEKVKNMEVGVIGTRSIVNRHTGEQISLEEITKDLHFDVERMTPQEKAQNPEATLKKFALLKTKSKIAAFYKGNEDLSKLPKVKGFVKIPYSEGKELKKELMGRFSTQQSSNKDEIGFTITSGLYPHSSSHSSSSSHVGDLIEKTTLTPTAKMTAQELVEKHYPTIRRTGALANPQKFYENEIQTEYPFYGTVHIEYPEH